MMNLMSTISTMNKSIQRRRRMATASTGDELNVAVRRISTLLRFLRSDMQAIPDNPNPLVAADGTHFDPVLLPCCLANGGIQGFKWYWRELRVDKDGDIADEFLDDISFS